MRPAVCKNNYAHLDIIESIARIAAIGCNRKRGKTPIESSVAESQRTRVIYVLAKKAGKKTEPARSLVNGRIGVTREII
jgi:hypothetical protein